MFDKVLLTPLHNYEVIIFMFNVISDIAEILSISISLFLYFINYRDIWSSGFYHVITLHGEIPQNFKYFVFNYTFWFMFIPNKFLHKTTNVSTFLHYHAYLCTPSGQVCCIHSLYEVQSFIETHILQRGDSPVLSILHLIQLVRIDCSQELHIKALVHPFKSLFLIHLHVLFLSLSCMYLANCRCIFLQSVHFSLFVLNFLEFFRDNCFLVCYSSTCSGSNWNQ